MHSDQHTITSGGIALGSQPGARPAIIAEQTLGNRHPHGDESPSMLLSCNLLDKIEIDLEKNETGVPLHGADAQFVEQYRSALPILIKAYKLKYGLPERARAD